MKLGWKISGNKTNEIETNMKGKIRARAKIMVEIKPYVIGIP